MENNEKDHKKATTKKTRLGAMNTLLVKWHIWIACDLLLATASIAALLICYYFVTPFDYYFYVAVGLLGFFIVATVILALAFNLGFRKTKSTTEIKAAEIVGNEADEAYEFGKIGLAVVDNDMQIVWANDFLLSRYHNIVDENLYDIFPGLQSISENSPVANLEYESHYYQAEYLKESHLVIFRDVTDFQNIQIASNKSAPVVGYLAIDNYADVQMAIGDDTRFADMVHDIREIITKFGSDTASLMRRIQDDRYLFITDNENYQKIKQTNFAVLDQVRKRFPDGFTISLGIAYGFTTYSKLAQKASDALDVALSRGGDQAVILPFQGQIIYVGGKTELQPSRNRVKIRSLSNSFTTLLKNYSQIVIVPHYNADLDAIGSALGVYHICQHLHLNAKICWDPTAAEDSTRGAVESEFNKDELDAMTGNMRSISALAGENTLYVAVDHNNPKQAIFPSIVKKFSHFVVIDHHRPGDTIYDDIELNGIDTSASSASELLTFYISYNANEIALDSRTATFLLAGISLDTRFFKQKATANTFEAAMILSKYGANDNEVAEFLKEEWDIYREKISILNSAETPYSGIVVACAKEDEIVNDTTLALAGNEAISIKGNQASFIIGRISPHEVKISGRSDGSISVQVILEKLGGGGHLRMAATKIKDVSVAEAKKELLAVLNDYLDDARMKSESEDKEEA
ncbi:MAG: DHH family phosphoesterase [Eubacteriales bacterium]|nr:DHH family phosphoesterase [Eubacteriales bacterium]